MKKLSRGHSDRMIYKISLIKNEENTGLRSGRVFQRRGPVFCFLLHKSGLVVQMSVVGIGMAVILPVFEGSVLALAKIIHEAKQNL